MNLADPKDITVKIVLLIPIILTLFSSYMIDKTNGNIIAGFNTMEEDKKEQLIKKGYLSKVKKMTFIMSIPLVIAFLSNFFVKNIKIYNDILMGAWGVFGIITILGIVVVNYSVRK
ncbi:MULTISPECIES: DUF3784 domain-containing protein [Peptoniphilus]|uniref:DUF3784 domain-containing protein n=1 Tax=Peptoniphilus TaxID=162289 RepID=UPI0001DC9E73|nr:DUF3784 domain-containing protein [Peptoniphilus sp. oral taxon 836]EFK38717.1 hypothetical protein HMPREF9131_0745 [Peptoniphilus sp. oral taxon 836 str. F0141]